MPLGQDQPLGNWYTDEQTGEECDTDFCCCQSLNLPGDKRSCYHWEGQRDRHWPHRDGRQRTQYVGSHSGRVWSTESNTPRGSLGIQNIKCDSVTKFLCILELTEWAIGGNRSTPHGLEPQPETCRKCPCLLVCRIGKPLKMLRELSERSAGSNPRS